MFDVLLESSLRAFVLAAGVGLLLALLRVRDPALRHTAWKIVLAGMMVMPLLVGGAPELEVPVLPSPETLEVAAGIAAPALSPIGAGLDAGRTPPPTDVVFRWHLVYLAVALAFLLRIAVGYGLGIRLVRSSDAVAVIEPLGGVRYRSGRRIAVPMTFGMIRPVIFLPPEFPEWPTAKRRAVLAHEHAHVRRRDFLTNLLASVARAFHWINPLAWWLERHLARLAEQAADDIAAGNARRAYAAFLIEIAESTGTSRVRGVAMAREPGLGRRIRQLSKGRDKMQSSTRTLFLVPGILVLLVAASCMTPTRAASGSSLAIRSVQQEAERAAIERRAALERETRAREAELERARTQRELERAVQLAELEAARELELQDRQARLEREIERQRAFEEVEVQRRLDRERELERRRADLEAQRERTVVRQSLADQIADAERQVILAREQLRTNEERLLRLIDRLEARESN